MSVAEKIYYSREERVKKNLHWLKPINVDRIKDEKTFKRVEGDVYQQYDLAVKCLEEFKQDLDSYFDNLYEIATTDTEVGEDGEDAHAGLEASYEDCQVSWGKTQLRLSCLAVQLGIDGNMYFEQNAV